MKRPGWMFLGALVLADGVFGALVGFVAHADGQAAHFVTSPAARAREVAASFLPSLRHEWPLVWLPVFLASVSAAPFLLQFFLGRHPVSPLRDGLIAAAAGVVTGLGVCALTGFFMPIVLAFVGGPQSTLQNTAAAVLYGPFLFALGMGAVLPLMFFGWVVTGGIGFGLLNAAALRLYAAGTRSKPPDDRRPEPNTGVPRPDTSPRAGREGRDSDSMKSRVWRVRAVERIFQVGRGTGSSSSSHPREANVHLIRRSIPAVGLALALLALGASRPPARTSGEPEARGRTAVASLKSVAKPCAAKTGARLSRRGMTAKAETARATSRPTRLDPLMAL